MDARNSAVDTSSGPSAPGDAATETDILIIGFGLSVVPLLRELQKDGKSWTIISNGQSIWDRLEQHGRLDFDMVSSAHTSLYSFELVNRGAEDRYLPTKEFQAFIQEYLDRYGANVLKDWVTQVENHASHSIVHTQSGRTFRARHLVVATAFKRRMNQLLNEFDYESARDKTIAITAMGDSVNLMISKLIPYDNRIILITNGFILLDKLSLYDGISYTLDQLEYHNLRYVSRALYAKTIATGMPFVVAWRKLVDLLSLGAVKPLAVDNVYYRHPLAIRNFKIGPRRALALGPLPNGIIAIKYWPIDSFQALFDNDRLAQSIADGYLLNDIAYFLEQGLVELWPKQETIVDRDTRTIRWKDKVIACDHIIDADYETPNLPPIVRVRGGTPPQDYQYACRDNFMGIVPRNLSNVYFIGYIRPTTGGLNNIVEMQCLFTHRMITDEGFNREIYGSIDDRIHRYDRYYRMTGETTPTDHLVHYGFYTEDIARLVGIAPRLSDCRSLKDLAMYFIFPNSAFKYRQSGRYAVAGVKELVERIYASHKGFAVVTHYVASYALLQLTAYVAVALLYYRGALPLAVVTLPLLLLIVLMNSLTAFVAANGFGRNAYVNLLLAAGLALTVLFPYPLVPIGSFLAACGLTWLFRRAGTARVPFNDLRNKRNPRSAAFFKRYLDTFRQVFAERAATRQRTASAGVPAAERTPAASVAGS